MRADSRTCIFLRLALALILTSALTSPAVPVSAAQKKEEEPQPIRVQTSLVLTEVTVKDKSGRTVDGLTKEDFQIFDDGSSQTISHFSRDQLPLAIALVVDISASIIPYLDQLQNSMNTLLLTLKPEDEVALFTFAYKVERRADLSRDKAGVAAKFNGISVGGSTDINDALYESARYLQEQAPAARRVIILISDNFASQEGKFPPKQVEDEVLKSDAALYSLKIPGDNPIPVQKYVEMAGPVFVNVAKIVPHTGGEILDVQKEGSLYAAFAALILRLKTRYTLGFTPDHPVQDGRFHSLELKLAPGRCKDCRLETKRGYFALPPSSPTP